MAKCIVCLLRERGDFCGRTLVDGLCPVHNPKVPPATPVSDREGRP